MNSFCVGNPAVVVMKNVSFSPAALGVLHRVDVIASDHEDETGDVKDANRQYLRAFPDATWMPLEIMDRRLICHFNVDDEQAYVSDVEIDS